MKTSLLLLSFLLSVLIIAGTSEPAAISVFGAGLLNLGKLIKKQGNRSREC
ncbi:MAG: hypothetical protein GY795_47075 [Desulfobacterales bacterium]|nr:hypothetical protein [Desulfobacterales bacterium]